jgi:hypothetical protein
MYPYYSRWTALTADDVAAIRTLYATAGTPLNPPTNPPITPPSAPPPAAPTVAITSPNGGRSFSTTSATTTLAGKAQHADGIARVTWANSRGGTGVASGRTSWVAGPVTLQTGANQITVTAEASSGGTASQSLTATYSVPTVTDRTAPTITITSPATTSAYTSAGSVSLSGAARDNVGVTAVTWADSIGNTGVAQGTTQWTAGPIALRLGANVITIRARDAAGNVARRSVVFTRR